MANTDGGYILFGVRDRKQQVYSPEGRIVGIPLETDLLKEFGEKILVIQPEISLDEIPTVAWSGAAWSDDSQRIASASYDGTVRVWDAFTGKNEQTYQQP